MKMTHTTQCHKARFLNMQQDVVLAVIHIKLKLLINLAFSSRLLGKFGTPGPFPQRVGEM